MKRECVLIILVVVLSAAVAALGYQVYALTQRVETLEERLSTTRELVSVLNEEINILIDIVCKESGGCGCGQPDTAGLHTEVFPERGVIEG